MNVRNIMSGLRSLGGLDRNDADSIPASWTQKVRGSAAHVSGNDDCIATGLSATGFALLTRKSGIVIQGPGSCKHRIFPASLSADAKKSASRSGRNASNAALKTLFHEIHLEKDIAQYANPGRRAGRYSAGAGCGRTRRRVGYRTGRPVSGRSDGHAVHRSAENGHDPTHIYIHCRGCRQSARASADAQGMESDTWLLCFFNGAGDHPWPGRRQPHPSRRRIATGDV